MSGAWSSFVIDILRARLSPWVLIGLGIAYLIYTKYAASQARRPPTEAILARRVRIRDDIVKHLRLPRREDAAPIAPPEYRAIIIRDGRHLDELPKAIGGVPWTKVYRVYREDVEVVLTGVRKAVQIEWELDTGRDRWRFLNEGEHPEDAIDAVPYGRIPIDYIENFDWGGVEDYNTPIFYCRYDSPFGDPYAAITYRAEWSDSEPHRFVELLGLRPERDEWSWIRRRASRYNRKARRLLRQVRKAIST